MEHQDPIAGNVGIRQNCLDGDRRGFQEVSKPELLGQSSVDVSHQSTGADEADAHYAALTCIEEAMMEPGFEEALSAFCRRHMHEFNDSEESKLSHHDTFQEYVALVEASLETRLAARLPDFDMARFLQWVEAQPAEALGSDVLDTLLSATDFQAFKAHVLSFKSEGALAGLAPSARGVASAASH